MKNWYLECEGSYYIQHHNTYEDENVRLSFTFTSKEKAEKFLAVLNEVEDDMSFSINGETMSSDEDAELNPDYDPEFYKKIK